MLAALLHLQLADRGRLIGRYSEAIMDLEHSSMLLGFAIGLSKDSNTISLMAGKGGLARLKKNPIQAAKQAAKVEAKHYWISHRASYKGKADFARVMMDKFPELTNAKVIEGWCRSWDRQSAS